MIMIIIIIIAPFRPETADWTTVLLIFWPQAQIQSREAYGRHIKGISRAYRGHSRAYPGRHIKGIAREAYQGRHIKGISREAC